MGSAEAEDDFGSNHKPKKADEAGLKAHITMLEKQLAEAKRGVTAQEREKMDDLVRRCHALEKQVLDMARERDRLYRSLGMQMSSDWEKARKLSQEEFYEQYRKPLSDDEIRKLLDATLHGPLPAATMNRVLSTLSEIPMMREACAAVLGAKKTPKKRSSRKVKT